MDGWMATKIDIGIFSQKISFFAGKKGQLEKTLLKYVLSNGFGTKTISNVFQTNSIFCEASQMF